MTNALVTGTTGFIGNWVVRELVEHGVNVVAVVRQGSEKLDCLEGLPVKVVPCDMENYAALPLMLAETAIDTVYHLAWRGVYGPDSRECGVQLRNIKGTLDLLEAAHTLGAHTFIGAGSLHELEGTWELALDKPITNPSFVYKSAKKCAHGMAKTQAGLLQMRFMWPVVTNAYGEGDTSGRLISSVIQQVMAGQSPSLTEGEQWYDFVHVSDAARAFRLLGESGINGTNYLIGSGVTRKLKDWLAIVGDVVNQERNGEPVELGFGRHRGFVAHLPPEAFSIESLHRDTGYAPQVPFEEGIRRAASV